MPTTPPDISQTGFLTILAASIAGLSENPPYLAGSIPCRTLPKDPPEKLNSAARFVIQVEYPQPWAISVRGKRLDMVIRPGEGIYFAPNAWSIEYWGNAGLTLGIVLLPHTLRLIQIRLPLETQYNAVPWAYHTAIPLGSGGMMTSRVLDQLAEDGISPPAARDLLRALLQFARQHLEEDAPAQAGHARAAATWRAVVAYLQENVSRPVTRQSAAEAMRLHPNYLSALARRMGGQSFQDVLDSHRAQQAQRLLRDTDLKLERIARLCGYSKAASLIKAFRRATGMTPGQFRKRPMAADPSH